MHRGKKIARRRLVFFSLLLVFILPGLTPAMDQPVLSKGQTVYVPVYSNVYSGPRANVFQLAAMVSIRNTDPKESIKIVRADYYDNEGKLVERYFPGGKNLAPLASTHIYIKEYDEKGGPGANFIITWQAKGQVNEPVIEALMLGLKGGQGISFLCPAKVIDVQN
ncbi:DUF3124 domain-containing protein [Desulfatibacillum aliphaticivorans]|uniref:DUF3124 domain-containing protein n=1 Tax=Desulfatibacillum aliphaticivorans TaxID=218208 RepID=UPI0004082D63|nr:DUF3124 domain-containing protein [Desulfatibacillum aliphaticivorans]